MRGRVSSHLAGRAEILIETRLTSKPRRRPADCRNHHRGQKVGGGQLPLPICAGIAAVNQSAREMSGAGCGESSAQGTAIAKAKRHSI
ncbi:hypothetical protein ACFLQ0_06780 [Nitrospinota bacterium]